MQITKIPATINKVTRQKINSEKKRRVAAYARVSTDHDEQLTSYEAQVDYYTNYIKSRSDWEFVKVYADEGISGCNTKKRVGFQTMVSDALAGKIDLIITKSVSRFARNTVDSLTTIRELKNHNVECYFEKENINTFDGKGELLLTIMSSLAQEEARSISENVTWGQRKRMADGKVSLAYSHFLGYDKGENGQLVINEEEAKVVRLIYKLFLEGYSCHSIANKLTEMKIKTPFKRDKWNQSTIRGILTNEKHKGDALLQKYYTSDFLTKKQKLNVGVVPQYYIEDDHEAIISKEVFEMVQNEIEKRMKSGVRYSGVSIFSNKVKCMECGSWYGSKVWHSTDKYRKVIYRCNGKYEKGKGCGTPHFTEDELKDISIKAINEVIKNKKAIIEMIETTIKKVCTTEKLEKEKVKLYDKINSIVKKQEDLIHKNSKVAQDQEKYNEEFEKVTKEYEETKLKYDNKVKEINTVIGKREELKKYIESLKSTKKVINEFDETLFAGLVEEIDVYKNKIIVVFKDGKKVENNL